MELKRNQTRTQLERISPPESTRDLLIWVGREMDYARAYCGANQALTEATVSVWVPKWEELVKKYGRARFHAGLDKALAKSKGFMPTPGVIEQEIESDDVEPQPKQWVKPVDWPQTAEQEREQREIHREFVEMVSQKFSGQSEAKLSEVELQERKEALKRQAKQGK